MYYVYIYLSNGKIIELNDGLSSLMMYRTMVHYQILTQLDRISPPFLRRSILTWSTQKHAVFVSRQNLKKTPFCCLKPPYDLVQSHFLLVKSTFFDICWVSQAPCSYWKVPDFFVPNGESGRETQVPMWWPSMLSSTPGSVPKMCSGPKNGCGRCWRRGVSGVSCAAGIDQKTAISMGFEW